MASIANGAAGRHVRQHQPSAQHPRLRRRDRQAQTDAAAAGRVA
jgi:hypothetical protein